YSWGDYGLTFLGLIGIAVPNFMLALVMMYFANIWFGTSIGHLMAREFLNEPMNWAKFMSILEHLWIPVVIIGTAGTAGMVRRLRANLLDELQKQYVTTARAKGVHPLRLLLKYPLRVALNFFISDIGSILPAIISGAEVTAIVLSLETTGPMLIRALQSQDMYLAGSFLMFLAFLTVIGVLVSDIALALLDPRIRLAGGGHEMTIQDQNPLPEPGAAMTHYVSAAPFDPYAAERRADALGEVAQASQMRLMWWRFKRHKMALASGILLALIYLSTLVSEFLAPYNLHTRNIEHIYAPPQAVHMIRDGRWVWPYTYGRDMALDMTNLRRVYTDDKTRVEP
ncbi:MAG: ABC transporter permease subunit, partial [Paracoccaceae bacterium]|nr:ABC transporter permease subunit [Paracoccaceae bacterium]